MDLKIKDVAELLSVSETTVRRWLVDGKIPAYRINHQIRFSRTEIEKWVMEQRVGEVLSTAVKQEEKISLQSKKTQKIIARSGTQQFSLYRAIHRGDVLQGLVSDSKERVIREAMGLIAPKLGVDAEVMSELLMDRERLMPTAIDRGIAIPHTRDFLLQDSFDAIFVVFPKAPIDYGALDGRPVDILFFLFACSDKRHLHLLAKIAHLFSSEKSLEFVRSQPDKTALLEYLKQWESHLVPA